jgi:hypothetical protein
MKIAKIAEMQATVSAPDPNERDSIKLRMANVELIRAKDGAARASHEACLTQASDPVIG